MVEKKVDNTESSLNSSLLDVQSAVCEGVICNVVKNNTVNVFGRNVSIQKSSELSLLNGITSTGLRTSALIDDKHLKQNLNNILVAARQHYPLVIQVKVCAFSSPPEIPGCFQLSANTPQEALDFSIIAHRIAEQSLVPGINFYSEEFEEAGDEVDIPNDQVLASYLGNSDDKIDSPTPSQKIIFGNHRRRIPAWSNLDNPMLAGAAKRGIEQMNESTAKTEFFYNHLQDIISQAFDEFAKHTGRAYQTAHMDGKNSAEHLVIITGAIFNRVKKVIDHNESFKTQIECVNLSLLQPLPTKSLEKIVKGKKSITVFDLGSFGIGQAKLVDQVRSKLHNSLRQTQVYSCIYHPSVSEELIEKSIANMLSTSPKVEFYLGVPIGTESSKYPKHKILIDSLNHEYPDLSKRSIFSSDNESTPGNQSSLELPHTIRQYQDLGPAYSKLSRFYDDKALFYRNGELNELATEPFDALASVPPATANFANFENTRATLPKFIPENCTGCGSCYINCPHAAIPPIVIGPEALIKAGMMIASNNGANISKLTPMVKNLAAICSKAIKEEGLEIKLAGDFLSDSFNNLVKQLNLEAEKLKSISEEFNHVLQAIDTLPVAVTEGFFRDPEKQEKGSGELFSLAIDPHSCTGCGVCVATCSDEALELKEQSQEFLLETQRQFQLWEQLPDTAADTIKRLHHDEYHASFAAILLSRSYYMTMSGGSATEQGAPAKSLLHLATAVTESVQQPTVLNQVNELSKLISSLEENIHNLMSASLPQTDFDSLKEVVKETTGGKVTLDRLMSQLKEKEIPKQIDANTLNRKLDLLSSIKDLKWTLEKGPTGTGRSRYSMAISADVSIPWAGAYPYNCFTTPVVLQSGVSLSEFALGSFQGQLRFFLDNIKLMHRASLEAKDKYEPLTHDLEIASLSWDGLTEDEKAMISPLLLIVDKESIKEDSWQGLQEILTCDYPIKVIALDNGHTRNSPDGHQIFESTTTTLIAAMLLKKSYVYQGSMGNSEDLYKALHEGIDSAKPALFNILAPEVNNHFITQENWPTLSSLAFSSRALPTLRFNPFKENSYIASCLHLEANSDCNSDWVSKMLAYKEGEETKELNYHITWADWAFTFKDWKDEFSELTDSEHEASLTISDYLQLSSNDRKSKIPVIIRVNDGELSYLKVSQKVINSCESSLSCWNSIREIGGSLIEFPEKLKDLVDKELSDKYDADLAFEKTEFEKRLKEQETLQAEAIRLKLRDKLVALARSRQTS